MITLLAFKINVRLPQFTACAVLNIVNSRELLQNIETDFFDRELKNLIKSGSLFCSIPCHVIRIKVHMALEEYGLKVVVSR
ncbi:MAG TPA: hypothetical protein VNN20_01285 [Thermodesulfobacteriota bacterium]|nr:hypothetical protein [Thermodesulfobacteriota bacterium]